MIKNRVFVILSAVRIERLADVLIQYKIGNLRACSSPGSSHYKIFNSTFFFSFFVLILCQLVTLSWQSKHWYSRSALFRKFAHRSDFQASRFSTQTYLGTHLLAHPQLATSAGKIV